MRNMIEASAICRLEKFQFISFRVEWRREKKKKLVHLNRDKIKLMEMRNCGSLREFARSPSLSLSLSLYFYLSSSPFLPIREPAMRIFFYESFRKVSHRIWVFPWCILNIFNRSHSNMFFISQWKDSRLKQRKKKFSYLYYLWTGNAWREWRKSFSISMLQQNHYYYLFYEKVFSCNDGLLLKEMMSWTHVEKFLFLYESNSSILKIPSNHHRPTNTHKRHPSLWAQLKINLLTLRAYFYWFQFDFHFTVINWYQFFFIDLLFLQADLFRR